ncbi:hypothetical protein [Ideonella sp. A 288]|uniref:hypothetical protein n=1 Tax=Ideonella sp. A 288 TaxID=1962181 RepID=UPI000B4B3747|nr:hypothetical protein [Ideonella sp. A 288]
MTRLCKHRHSTTEQIALDEFLDYADAHVIEGAPDKLFRLGEQLSMLGNNRRFLSDFMCSYIKANRARDPLAEIISQSVVLARRKHFYLRANFWLPAAEMTQAESLLFAYHQAHDHNFDLLSYAYCGTGYETDVFEYDYAAVAGFVGEEVRVRPLGTFRHACGDTIMYRCNQDIHIQQPPTNLSVTLNVIPTFNQHGLLDQYFFDIDATDPNRARLSNYAYTAIDARRQLLELVSQLRDDNVTDLLVEFATRHDCRRTRYNALRALQDSAPEVHDSVCASLGPDEPALVRHHLVASESPAQTT